MHSSICDICGINSNIHVTNNICSECTQYLEKFDIDIPNYWIIEAYQNLKFYSSLGESIVHRD